MEVPSSQLWAYVSVAGAANKESMSTGNRVSEVRVVSRVGHLGAGNQPSSPPLPGELLERRMVGSPDMSSWFGRMCFQECYNRYWLGARAC